MVGQMIVPFREKKEQQNRSAIQYMWLISVLISQNLKRILLTGRAWQEGRLLQGEVHPGRDVQEERDDRRGQDQEVRAHVPRRHDRAQDHVVGQAGLEGGRGEEDLRGAQGGAGRKSGREGDISSMVFFNLKS